MECYIVRCRLISSPHKPKSLTHYTERYARGKKYLRCTIDGLLLVGLNVDEWYLRVRERCASDCCWRIDDSNRERHMVVVASNTTTDHSLIGVIDPDATFCRAEEYVALCAQILGIPDDEVES